MSGPVPDGSGLRPFARQVVRAEGGFAYGVIGADIHVFGDGRPVYVLRSRAGPPAADPEWLLELPSRMLSTRHEVVPFTGRERDVAALRTWRDTPRRLAARWLHGPGGQGKSRLAARLGAESSAEGWLVVVAVHGSGTVLPPPGSQDLRAEGATGVLVIVDYADHWPLPDLAWLFSNALLHRPGLPARVLLLARDATSWPAVRATLADVEAATSRQVLEPLADDGEEGGDRAAMFRAARDAFADRYGLPAPRAVGPPVALVEPEFGLTLTVHMAALAAVDARRTGRRPPADAAGLTTYLLDREQRHWARLADVPGYVTPPAVMNRAVFAAALTGAVERRTGTAAVDSLRLRLPARTVLADHGACYPPADPALPTVLEPLTPDRLAEEFVALTLPGHPADYPAHDWAPAALDALLPQTVGAPAAPWLSRAMTVLASAAGRWPHVGRQHLYPLLRQAPWLAVAAGGAPFGALVALEDIDIDLLEAIEAYLPRRDDAVLDPAAAALAVRLAEHRMAASDDPAAQAAVQLNLGWNLAGAGRYDESLASVGRAVALYEAAAHADPERYEPDLARALNNFATELDREQRGDEALSAIESAIAIRRRRLRPGRDSDTADLALSLSNYAIRLQHAGRRLEALRANGESLTLYAQVAAERPERYDHDLAVTLVNIGSSLHSVLRVDAALAATRRAVAVLRTRARDAPAAHEGMLAQGLTNLTAMLASAGRRNEAVVAQVISGGGVPGDDLLRLRGWRTEALAAATQAVEIRRGGARANPAALTTDLAGALRSLAQVQEAVGLRDEARVSGHEADGLERNVDPRRLPRTAPELVEHGTGHVVDEVVLGLYRYLAASEVTVHGPHLVVLLRAPRAGSREPGFLAEALEVGRRLADADPVTYEPVHLHEMWQFAWELWWAGRHEEAVGMLEQAVELARALDTEVPGTYRDRFVRYADDLATWLKAVGRRRDARTVRRAARRHARER
ncbi:tetratricopeptide repeat protein [Streptomyces sp. H27-H1]|uniref:tetratricopeptide repeat protein n=1 Tax=Streptomyces sp. H27-H1 TaxID=2996461 RepID=UPI00226DF683|nr:tetratricopeptide repeat protein [Streptomyces sp. H27-H1]MCY0928979.1 tetratricopeptide repeat protein [Streptomyces sp. H27-H1]